MNGKFFIIIPALAGLVILFILPSLSETVPQASTETIKAIEIPKVDFTTFENIDDGNTTKVIQEPEEETIDTVTSEDDRLTQALENNGLAEPENSAMLVIEVTKTPTEGEPSTTKTEVNFIGLDITAKKGTNIDYKNGFFDSKLIIKTPNPKTSYHISGDFVVEINGKSYSTIQISGEGITNNNGEGIARFNTDTGFHQLKIKSIEDKINVGDNKIKYLIKDAEIKLKNKTIELQPIKEEIIFEFEIEKDDFQILVTDENGEIIRMNPKDSKLFISSEGHYGNWPKNSKSHGCKKDQVIPTTIGKITITNNVDDEVITRNSFHVDNVYYDSPNPSVGKWAQNPNDCEYKVEPLIELDIYREKVYFIKIGPPQNLDFELHPPRSQKSYNFWCGENGSFGRDDYDYMARFNNDYTDTAFCNFPNGVNDIENIK